jgi:hypothetical protein
MRENRTYGSEGGEGPNLFPTPIVFDLARLQSVDARHKAGHDEGKAATFGITRAGHHIGAERLSRVRPGISWRAPRVAVRC